MDFAGWLWISQGGFFILLTFEQRSSLPDESKAIESKKRTCSRRVESSFAKNRNRSQKTARPDVVGRYSRGLNGFSCDVRPVSNKSSVPWAVQAGSVLFLLHLRTAARGTWRTIANGVAQIALPMSAFDPEPSLTLLDSDRRMHRLRCLTMLAWNYRDSFSNRPRDVCAHRPNTS
jgi:hypothetical protein